MTPNSLSMRLLEAAVRHVYDAVRAEGRCDVLEYRPLDRRLTLAMLDDLRKSLNSSDLRDCISAICDGDCDLVLPGADAAKPPAASADDAPDAPTPDELLRRRRDGLTHRMRQLVVHVNDLVDRSWGGEPQVRLDWHRAWHPAGPPQAHVFEDIAAYFKTRGWLLTLLEQV